MIILPGLHHFLGTSSIDNLNRSNRKMTPTSNRYLPIKLRSLLSRQGKIPSSVSCLQNDHTDGCYPRGCALQKIGESFQGRGQKSSPGRGMRKCVVHLPGSSQNRILGLRGGSLQIRRRCLHTPVAGVFVPPVVSSKAHHKIKFDMNTRK